MAIFRHLLSISCLSLFYIHLCAQDTRSAYDRRWAIIDSLVNRKGLTESALAEVNQIYATAAKEHNEPQQIKALVYRINLAAQKTGEAEPAAIRTLEKAEAEAAQPAKAILQTLLANAYWAYLQQNRYKLYNRTNTVAFQKEDIATWSADDLRQKIAALYLSSLKEEKMLKQLKLEDYDPIIIRGNVRYLRPALFDLLAHAALDYFATGEQDFNKPANIFEINDPAAFADAAIFAEHPFVSTDSNGLHFYALQLFQRLIRFHLADTGPDALIDVDIQRLNFVHNYSVSEDKEDQYVSALTRLTDRWGSEPAAAEAWYLLAQRHAEKAIRFNPPLDTAGRYEYVAVKVICEKVIKEKDSSEGKAACAQLLRQLLSKTLELHIETVNLPGQPFRSLVVWRNIPKLYGRILQADHTVQDDLGYNTSIDSYWQKLLRLPVVRSFAQILPETGDYQTHRAEIRIDALPVGEYALVTCSDSSFPVDQYSMQRLSVAFFHVSAISFITNGWDYFVLDRENGQPFTEAMVQVHEKVYDRKSNRNVAIRAESYQTDEHGHFVMKERSGNDYGRSMALEISTGNDHLFIDAAGYRVFSFNREDLGEADKWTYEKKYRQTYFFTDRSIYRPGQTLYYKGIVITRDFETHRVKTLAQWRTKVILRDVNNNVVDSQEVVTNDFGSYHGQFLIPDHLLNGQFRISDDSTGMGNYFSVEEYKRPEFFVGYDTLKASYRVGDSIRIEGYAKTFAGNMIDGALVKYRVVRQAHVPGGWWPYHSREVQEVVHGVVKADQAGRFSIRFVATADKSIDKGTNPVFEYTVSADVTDISGETRSGNTIVRAGYRSLQLSIDEPANDHLPADSLKKLVVRATNLSGGAEAVMAEVAVYSLRWPNRLIRARYWPAPDEFILSPEEYHRSFPHDDYDDETNKDKWESEQKVFSGLDSAGRPVLVTNDSRKVLAPGWYRIEARAKDKDGQPVEARRYIEIYDGATGRPPMPQYEWALREAETVEPGDEAHVEIGSSAGNVFVIRQVERIEDDRTRKRVKGGQLLSFFTLDKERKTTAFQVTESDRGGFGVSDVYVKDNRVYTRLYTVKVPWTNKKLDIHYSSFRDKTLPGSGEKWAVTISGQHMDRVTAEVLAGMYDASLDQFRSHGWSVPPLYPVYQPTAAWEGNACFSSKTSQWRNTWERDHPLYVKQYDELLPINGGRQIFWRFKSLDGRLRQAAPAAEALANVKVAKGLAVQVPDLEKDTDGSKGLPPPTQPRKDFRETAFFFPGLQTDTAGNTSFSFTMPEALTTWNWMTLAHTRDLAFGYSERSVITQKELMVQPNAPRFLREGDRMELPVKVVNLTDSELTGQMSLQLSDPTTGQTADGWFTNRQANQYFTVGAHQSVVVGFPLDIPYQYNRPLTYRVTAQAHNYSDGEEATLPVVSNRMLVTESLPLNMPGDGTRHFTFDKLLRSESSETLNHHALTVEFTANPAWYAVQALPYLMEYPYECAEQIFNRAYANALATKIAGSRPRLQQVFEQWRTTDTAALLSNLQKDPELKNVLLEETPWVLEGKTEAQQKKNIALLFDLGRMSRELESALDRLSGLQSPGGGFPWFKGGYDDRYITQYILTGIAHLQRLQAIPPALAGKVRTMVSAALPWLDARIKEDYLAAKAAEDRAGTKNGGRPVAQGAGGKTPVIILPGGIGLAVQYLYMRSSFSDYGTPGDVFPAINYYRKKARQHWLGTGRYLQGMIALALYRTGDVQTAKDILASLKQNAIRDEEKGMYWKGMEGGYYWYQAPIETQSLLIEAFREIGGDAAIDRDLKTWLLRQKQTHNWATTKATADACYALMSGGQNWLNADRNVEIVLGDKKIEWADAGAGDAGGAGEAGTGYEKKVFDGPFVNPRMGNITVTMQAKKAEDANAAATGSPAWGAVYWQYFDLLDRVTPPGQDKAALKLEKKLFVSRNTDRGPVLEPIADNGALRSGDKVVVRIVIAVDRDLEYVHMKDMRAACLEPENVISQYKWQGGLGYYESTKEASTNFFFDRLPKGVYVFEYRLFAGQAGNFSNGVTSIECLYAPEFSFHSEGIRVNVEAAR